MDGTRNRVLLMRFAVEGYPSIYLLRDGKTWQYNGARGLQQVLVGKLNWITGSVFWRVWVAAVRELAAGWVVGLGPEFALMHLKGLFSWRTDVVWSCNL